MDVFTTTASAATIAGLLTSLAKFGFPNLPSYAILVVSLVAGIGASFLVSIASGDAQSVQQAAQSIILGILAAATAAGISRADRSSDEKRTLITNQDGVK